MKKEKKYPRHVEVWVTEETVAELDRWAREEERSRAWVIRDILGRAVEQRRRMREQDEVLRRGKGSYVLKGIVEERDG